MKLYLELNIKNSLDEYKMLTDPSFQKIDFAVIGLPDVSFCKYPVDTCIKITDKNIKNITCNNNFVIDIKILKNKNIINKRPDEYIISFKKSGSGSITLFNKNGSSRTFGLIGKLKTSKLKFGNKFEKGLKYEKFWQNNHVDLLYSTFSQENSNNDFLYFVNSSLEKASIPVIIYNNNLDNLDIEIYKNKLEILLDYLNKINFNIIFLIEPKCFYIKQKKDIIDIYKILCKRYKNISFGICIEIQSIYTRLDCTRNIGQIDGLYLLTKEAEILNKNIKELEIPDEWLICFNNNRTDSFCKDVNNIHFNNDVFLNYLYFIIKSTTDLKNEKMLYNVPVGLINKTNDIKHSNTRSDYEDGSQIFIFGGKIKTKSSFYRENLWGDTISYTPDIVEIPSKIDFLIKNNIKYILFGSELPQGTTSNYSLNSVGKCGDKGYLLKKIKEYEESFI